MKNPLFLWFLRSFQDHTGKTSGKAMSTFAVTLLVIAVVIVTMIYSEKHLLPEYMWWGLLALIGGNVTAKSFGPGKPAKALSAPADAGGTSPDNSGNEEKGK